MARPVLGVILDNAIVAIFFFLAIARRIVVEVSVCLFVCLFVFAVAILVLDIVVSIRRLSPCTSFYSVCEKTKNR